MICPDIANPCRASGLLMYVKHEFHCILEGETMKIFTDAPEGMTVVQNAFIDRFMPHANGEFVKVYLYLLRCADTGQELSLASIADVFDHTEKDIRRALTYWEKQQLLKLKLSSDGTILSAIFLTPPSEERATYVPAGSTRLSGQNQASAGIVKTIPNADKLSSAAKTQDMPTRARIKALSEQEEIRQLFFIAEQYLQRALSSAEQGDLIYYYDTLHFSPDLIEYLLEYCISKDSTSRHYMRKVALGWAEAGISTVAQAKQETNLYNKNYYTILNTFGIKGRAPATPEQEMMSRWFHELGFSIDLVLEACRRTIRQIHQPSFEYADSILTNWHELGVKSMADVVHLDAQHKQEQAKPADRQTSSAGSNRFNNFSSRKYDYSQLEKKLLNP